LWIREPWRGLGLGGHRSWLEVERISSAKYPEGGEEVVEKRTSGNGDGIEDSRLNGTIGFEKQKEKIKKKDLKEKGEGSGEVVVFGLSPRGRPRMEGPCCVEEEVCPTAHNPSDECSSRGNPMTARIEPKKNISERKKSPHEEGIENCSCPAD
jgi:hypothetical protein